MRRVRRVGSESTGPGLGFTERTPGLNGLMHTAIAHRLAEDLRSAGFTTQALRSIVGDAAESALMRAIAVPARRILARHPHDAVAVLARLFVLGDVVDAASVALSANDVADLDALVERIPVTGARYDEAGMQRGGL